MFAGLRAPWCGAALCGLLAASSSSGAQERLIFTSLSPAGSSNSQFFNAWAKRVSEESKGALRIEVRDGVTLANYGNIYDRVTSDVVQIGWAIHQVVAGKFPLSEVAGLPFVSSGGGAAASALWKLNASGVLAEEYKDIVPLVFGVFGPAQVHFARPPRGADDLQGVKVGVQGRVPSQLVSALGGTPISIQPGDFYEALQRGTLEAAIVSWAAFAPYKLHEVTAHHIEGALGQSTSMFFMSRARFNALPPEARRALEAVAAEATTAEFSAHFDKQWSDARAPVAADPNKHKVVELSAAQTQAWRARAEPIIEEWAKGRPNGVRALEEFRRLVGAAK